jgi:hypothetical protein
VQRSILWILLCAFLAGSIGLGLLAARADAAPPPRGDIAGLVLGNGSPKAGAIVQLFNGPGFIDYVAQTTSDSSGHFRFRKIAAGDYSVVAQSLSQGQVCTGNAPVTVIAGQTVNVTVEMNCVVFPP